MNLAYRMRPRTLAEFVGQCELVREGKIIERMVREKALYSMIFWGPPGSGKTTLAEIIARESGADFHALSATSSGKEAFRGVVRSAEEAAREGRRTVLFIDEIHRWSKAQQDALLPYVESGLMTLIGATTENPSFEVVSPLLSRCRVFVLTGLGADDLRTITDRALADTERGLGKQKVALGDDAKQALIRLSGGDARILLNALELAADLARGAEITVEFVEDVFQRRSAGIYDKKADSHYDTVSAFIKSMRGSDPDAALYYLARMIESGEDPEFIARRMVIFASEDVGLADRGALIQANGAFDAVRKVGFPEASLTLAHIALYLALAPKSRNVPNALRLAREAALEFPNEPIPLHLRNAPTELMKELGYAEGYEWSRKRVGPKDESKSFFPEKLKGKKFLNHS